MNNVMIDLETLGVRADAVILSLGAVRFDPLGPGEQPLNMPQHLGPEFRANISIQSCLDAGLRIDGSTVEWWFQQSEAARKSLFEPKPVPLSAALANFARWMQQTGEMKYTKAWSHGVTFDVVILGEAYAHLGQKPPWMYKLARDTRTLFAETPGYFDAMGQRMRGTPGIEHDCLDDAKEQVKWVQYAWWLREGAK